MERVIIIGCPGSGKSTFGRKLGKVFRLPLYHLDNLFWNEDGTNVPREIFDERLENVMSKKAWIIDGNYARTMETRMKACDTIFFLDYEKEICLKGIEERKGKKRSDMPWVEGYNTDEEFVSFVKEFNTENRPKIIELLEKYSNKNIVVFKTREEAEEFLEI